VTVGQRVVFLDRDGVLVVPEVRDGKGYAIHKAADLRTYPDVVTALGRLKQAGFCLVVVTNQPDVASGLLERFELDEMHTRLLSELSLDRIRVCPHARGDFCDCRKPRPGLLLADDGLGLVDYGSSWMVGDRDLDIAAGRAAGCRTVFVDRSWREESGVGADVVADSMTAASNAILARC
jgi:D-glycero-D-manno-heptose 1,7-bisphosphate phosphatase